MLHTRLGVERPGEGQHLSKRLTAGAGVAGVTQMPWFPGITTNVEARGENCSGHAPAGDSLIEPPLPDMLKGEGEELETGPGVEFILEFHPGKKKSKVTILPRKSDRAKCSGACFIPAP